MLIRFQGWLLYGKAIGGRRTLAGVMASGAIPALPISMAPGILARLPGGGAFDVFVCITTAIYQNGQRG